MEETEGVPGPPGLALRIDPEIAPRVRLGLVTAAPVSVAPSGAALNDEIARVAADLAGRYRGRVPSEIPGLAPARELYRTFGIDPTRVRPSSEALLRRILRDKPFPVVNNAVDLANLCAVDFLLPIGLYDAGRLRGDVELRRGRDGESYPGIRKDDVHVAGRPVLVDDAGPFGNPSSDSLRTSVTPETESLWMVIFAPASFPQDRMTAHVATARERIDRHLR